MQASLLLPSLIRIFVRIIFETKNIETEMSPVTVMITVAAYIALLFGGGDARASRRADNSGFFTGGRRTHWAVAALAMVGAAISGVTFISVPGSVAADGFSYADGRWIHRRLSGHSLRAHTAVLPHGRGVAVRVSRPPFRHGGAPAAAHGSSSYPKMLGASIRAYVICAVLQIADIRPHSPYTVRGHAAVMMSLVWLLHPSRRRAVGHLDGFA